jgi:hypothetical protein
MGRNTRSERNELPPPHSITSSARARKTGGIVRPSGIRRTDWYEIGNRRSPGQSGSSALGYMLGGVLRAAQQRQSCSPPAITSEPAAPTSGASWLALRCHCPCRQQPIKLRGSRSRSGRASNLIGQTFQDRDGGRRRIGVTDILVVTPYNARVNCCRRLLPPPPPWRCGGQFPR